VEPELSVTDLRKSFLSPAGERIEVLKGISFLATPGRTLAITGASGAGKSTLLHLLGGLEAPDHGSIALGRFEIDRAKPAALANFRSHQVGFIFQFHHLLSDLSAAENVALPLLIARRSRPRAMKRAVKALESIELGARSAHPVGHLSGGEQQRVAACRALITQPSLVLADEPTGNLDASFAAGLGEILVSYAHRCGAIVIIATHNERLAQLCDRILSIRDGRLSET
jgi:lipoprotein-releasing system ATP-binding protein